MSNAVMENGAEPGLQADQRLLDRGWLRIGAGLAVAAQAMVFSLAVNLSEIEGWSYVVVHGILMGAALASLVFLGSDLVRSAVNALGERRISIDLLFLVTLIGALVGSMICTFTRTGSVYYEVVAILIVVHTAGKMLGARSRVAALRAAGATREQFDRCHVVLADGTTVLRRPGEVAAGEVVRIAPGDAIGVDGEVRQGRGFVQETAMTGEWRPVVRGPGDLLLAGTYSVDGSFELVARGGPRRLDGILAEVEQARLAPSVLQAQADRLMRWFLPLVIGVSGATFLVWISLATWDRALFNAMAVLLVACPCAMGLATPVALWGGLARLARFGLVARSADFLDRIAGVEVLCIDKTGTLSTDRLLVRAWVPSPLFSGRTEWLRAAVATAEEGLSHPVAGALRMAVTEAERFRLSGRELVPAAGVLARLVDPAGVPMEVAVGEWTMGGRYPAGGDEPDGPATPGKRVHVYIDGAHAAVIELEESWREGLVETLAAVRAHGVAVEVLSGDDQAEAAVRRAIGGRMAVSDVMISPGMTPLEKKQRVDALLRAGRSVLFVGDGINDAAAMSAASVSVAVRSGTELARASAMAVLAGDDLRALPAAIEVAREARAGIRQNLLFAATYNAVGMVLAAGGLLHPIAAAFLMVGSSLFVSVRALRSTHRDVPAPTRPALPVAE